MYYSQLGFEIVFYSPCNITDVVYRRWAGVRGVGWGGGSGWQAGGRQKLPLGCIEWCCPLIGDKYVHNPLDGSRQTLSAV